MMYHFLSSGRYLSAETEDSGCEAAAHVRQYSSSMTSLPWASSRLKYFLPNLVHLAVLLTIAIVTEVALRHTRKLCFFFIPLPDFSFISDV